MVFLKVWKEFKGGFEIERLPWLAVSDRALKRKSWVEVVIHFYSHAVNSMTNGLCKKFVYCLEIPLRKIGGNVIFVYAVLIKYCFGYINKGIS